MGLPYPEAARLAEMKLQYPRYMLTSESSEMVTTATHRGSAKTKAPAD
jgi:hypothetical protein